MLEARMRRVGDVQRIKHGAQDEEVPEAQVDREGGEDAAVA